MNVHINPTGQCNVLVIDDEAEVRELVCDSLGASSQFGARVHEAKDGDEGIHILLDMDRPISLILIDWSMHSMGGLDFVQAIRKINDFGSIPVIMITSRTEFTCRLQAIEAGAAGYIEKPFTSDSLSRSIQTILEWEGATLSSALALNA